MAKRRERRVVPSADRRRSRVESGSRLDHFGDSVSDRKLITIFILFFIVIPAVTVLLYCTKYSTRVNRAISEVNQRRLIKSDVNYEEILSVSAVCTASYDGSIYLLTKVCKYSRNIQRFPRMSLIGTTRILYWLTLLHGLSLYVFILNFKFQLFYVFFYVSFL